MTISLFFGQAYADFLAYDISGEIDGLGSYSLRVVYDLEEKGSYGSFHPSHCDFTVSGIKRIGNSSARNLLQLNDDPSSTWIRCGDSTERFIGIKLDHQGSFEDEDILEELVIPSLFLNGYYRENEQDVAVLSATVTKVQDTKIVTYDSEGVSVNGDIFSMRFSYSMETLPYNGELAQTARWSPARCEVTVNGVSYVGYIYHSVFQQNSDIFGDHVPFTEMICKTSPEEIVVNVAINHPGGYADLEVQEELMLPSIFRGGLLNDTDLAHATVTKVETENTDPPTLIPILMLLLNGEPPII